MIPTFVSSDLSMETQEETNYQRIAQAIEYIQTNFKQQPSLDEIAEHIHLSPFHFQRLFSEWAGTSPKKFLQYTSLAYAKKMLKEPQSNLFDTALETGFSGTSRLHDLFVNIEGMTPAEYKNGGKNLSIAYHFDQSPFGEVLVASTDKGICHLSFIGNRKEAVQQLKNEFPQAYFQQKKDSIQEKALTIFSKNWQESEQIKLHLKGSDFQLKIWESLLKIPLGKLSTYGEIAQSIDNPNASRAVGTAIGSNPVAFLIPCHRVIQSSGKLGGYMWGTTRKTALIAWEAGKVNPEE